MHMAKVELSDSFNQNLVAGAATTYAVASPTQITETTLADSGTLVRRYNFTAQKPTVEGFLVNNGQETALGTKDMSDFKDTPALSKAHTALLREGGKPFGIRK